MSTNVRTYVRIRPPGEVKSGHRSSRRRSVVTCVQPKSDTVVHIDALEEHDAQVLDQSQEHGSSQQQQKHLSARQAHAYRFDAVMGSQSEQKDVYVRTGMEQAVEEVLAGYNFTVLAYGASGSGKTYSMMGDLSHESHYGLIPRVAQRLHTSVEAKRHESEISISCAYLEIYMENVFDLLQNPVVVHVPSRNAHVSNNRGTEPMVARRLSSRSQSFRGGMPVSPQLGSSSIHSTHPQEKSRLCDLHEDEHGNFYPKGVLWELIEEWTDVMEVLKRGHARRHEAGTQLNDHSSRSHAMLIIRVDQRHKQSGQHLVSDFTLVDLAGSEQVNMSGAAGETLDQAKFINQSLSTLALVIRKLGGSGGGSGSSASPSTGKRRHSRPATAGSMRGRTPQRKNRSKSRKSSGSHIPYRNSKLTRLLKQSLGGNAKLSLLLTASPVLNYRMNTLSTFRFGQSVKNLPNKAQVNAIMTLDDYRLALKKARKTIKEQRVLLKILESENESLVDKLKASDGSGQAQDSVVRVVNVVEPVDAVTVGATTPAAAVIAVAEAVLPEEKHGDVVAQVLDVVTANTDPVQVSETHKSPDSGDSKHSETQGKLLGLALEDGDLNPPRQPADTVSAVSVSSFVSTGSSEHVSPQHTVWRRRHSHHAQSQAVKDPQSQHVVAQGALAQLAHVPSPNLSALHSAGRHLRQYAHPLSAAGSSRYGNETLTPASSAYDLQSLPDSEATGEIDTYEGRVPTSPTQMHLDQPFETSHTGVLQVEPHEQASRSERCLQQTIVRGLYQRIHTLQDKMSVLVADREALKLSVEQAQTQAQAQAKQAQAEALTNNEADRQTNSESVEGAGEDTELRTVDASESERALWHYIVMSLALVIYAICVGMYALSLQSQGQLGPYVAPLVVTTLAVLALAVIGFV